MIEIDDKLLQNAMAYMRNLPNIYVEELELNEEIFWGIMGHICDITSDMKNDKENDSNAPEFMPLAYESVQLCRSKGFPEKFVFYDYSKYTRTINATIFVYYKILRNDKRKLSHEEYKRMFGRFFLDKHSLEFLQENDILSFFSEDERNKIRKEKLSGYWQKKFEENWKKKDIYLLDKRGENRKIIIKKLYPAEEFDRVLEEATTLAETIRFLNKLEVESHERRSDNVLIPYTEYHALHQHLLHKPRVKAKLKDNHMKMVDEIERLVKYKKRRKI